MQLLCVQMFFRPNVARKFNELKITQLFFHAEVNKLQLCCSALKQSCRFSFSTKTPFSSFSSTLKSILTKWKDDKLIPIDLNLWKKQAKVCKTLVQVRLLTWIALCGKKQSKTRENFSLRNTSESQKNIMKKMKMINATININQIKQRK